jgi:medium-chain acyl-[acyl-carrier-protein] hydrolase
VAVRQADGDLERWFVRPRLAAAAASFRWRLFCFPGAGGLAVNFSGWAAGFPKSVDLCLAQLPGREERADEAMPGSIRDLAAKLADVVAPSLDRPFALFGYSMGGLVAFELARRLQMQRLPTPRHLFVAACRSPVQARPLPPVHHLPSEDFWREVSDGSAAPPADAIRAELEPRFRADLHLMETYRLESRVPVACPITLFGGREDTTLAVDDLMLWSGLSAVGCDIVVVDGGHGFLFETPAAGAEVRLRILQAFEAA